MKKITSAANPAYKALTRLAHSSRERRKAGISLLDGFHLLSAFIQNAGVPEQVVVSESGLEIPEVRTLIDRLAPVPLLLVSDALYRGLSTLETPTGLLAAVRTPRPAALPAVIDSCVLLDDIQDPGNLGSILRSAAASGVRQVFLSRDSVHAWSPRVLRAGMGAHFTLTIYEQVDLAVLLGSFHGRTIATGGSAIRNVFDTDLTGDIAFIFGNEGRGVSSQLLALAHEQVSIPMPGAVESLNVAAAAAVCLFERVRQCRGATIFRADRQIQ